MRSSKTRVPSWRWGRYVGAALLVGAGIVLVTALPVSDWSRALTVWIQDAGPSGVAVLAVGYVVFGVLMLPASVLTVSAGFVYGPVWGTILVLPVSGVAALINFGISRTAARERVARRVAQSPSYPVFAAIDGAIERHGFRLVALLRLSPVLPFNILSYALGLTRVGTRDFIVATLIGVLPSTFLYAYLGSLVTDLTAIEDVGTVGPVGALVYWGGIVVTLLVSYVIARTTQRSLDEALAPTTTAARQAPDDDE